MTQGYDLTQFATAFATSIGAEALKAYDYTTKKIKAQATAAWNSLPTVTLDDVTGYLNKGKEYITSTKLYKDISDRACEQYNTASRYLQERYVEADACWGTTTKWMVAGGLGTAIFLSSNPMVMGLGAGLAGAYGGYNGVHYSAPEALSRHIRERDAVAVKPNTEDQYTRNLLQSN